MARWPVLAAVYLVIFPLGFASGVFVPTETMPAWLQVFTEHQPVSVVTGALRGLILGAGALPAGQTVGGQVALALLWSAAIMAVIVPLAVQLYRRSASGDCQR
jgi:ABC-2 type transport system permease protein/oleandomycin transport system permease protein